MNTVAGWFDPRMPDILQFLTARQEPGDVIEIGCYAGASFLGLLATLTNTEKAIALDWWDKAPPESYHVSLDTFRGNCRGWENRYEVIQANSLDADAAAVRRVLPGPFRIAHVDGGHSYAVASHDIRLAAALIDVPTGIILIDDVFNPSFPDVYAAVLDWWRSEPAWHPLWIGCNKVAFTRAPIGTWQGLAASVSGDWLGHRVATLLDR